MVDERTAEARRIDLVALTGEDGQSAFTAPSDPDDVTVRHHIGYERVDNVTENPPRMTRGPRCDGSARLSRDRQLHRRAALPELRVNAGKKARSHHTEEEREGPRKDPEGDSSQGLHLTDFRHSDSTPPACISNSGLVITSPNR